MQQTNKPAVRSMMKDANGPTTGLFLAKVPQTKHNPQNRNVLPGPKNTVSADIYCIVLPGLTILEPSG